MLEEVAQKNLACASHDVADGGLFVTLLEMAMPRGLGFDIVTDDEVRLDGFLFGEAQGRAIVSLKEADQDDFFDVCDAHGIRPTLLGHVTKGKLVVDDKHFGFCEELRAYYDNALEEAMTEGDDSVLAQAHGRHRPRMGGGLGGTDGMGAFVRPTISQARGAQRGELGRGGGDPNAVGLGPRSGVAGLHLRCARDTRSGGGTTSACREFRQSGTQHPLDHVPSHAAQREQFPSARARTPVSPSAFSRPEEFDVSIEEEVNSLLAGKVIRAEKAGTKLGTDDRLPKGSSITLVVGTKGSEMVRVPWLMGLSLKDARGVLSRRNLAVGYVEYSPSVRTALDTTLAVVVDQDQPFQGASSEEGTAIDLYLGKH